VGAWGQLDEEARFSLADSHGRVRKPAHFSLLFPEVFSRSRAGFDAVIGNPPFLGGTKISGAFGAKYREHLVRVVANGVRGGGRTDLVAYMFLRATTMTDPQRGQIGLIATNSLAQGDTREVGLDQITADGFDIRAAVKSAKWPTQGANLEYCIVWASRRQRQPGVRAVADGVLAAAITPSLDPAGRVIGNPHRLMANRGMIFLGSYILGFGFTMTAPEAQEFIANDERNREVLFPYVNGEDLNSDPTSCGSRWVVDFRERSESQARQWPDAWNWIERRVKPERMTKDAAKYPRMVDEWWKHWRSRPGLYAAARKFDHVIAMTRISKAVMPVMVSTAQVINDGCVVFATDDLAYLALLSSAPNYWWAISHGATFEARIIYTPSDVFETLPLPSMTNRMRVAAEALEGARTAFMVDRQLGLTSTYNLIHESANMDLDITHLRELHAEVDQA